LWAIVFYNTHVFLLHNNDAGGISNQITIGYHHFFQKWLYDASLIFNNILMEKYTAYGWQNESLNFH
jgi:hypothetical protein